MASSHFLSTNFQRNTLSCHFATNFTPVLSGKLCRNADSVAFSIFVEKNHRSLTLINETMNKFAALFMALLIGNPICCCAMANLFVAEKDDSAPVHSCCMTAENAEENDNSPEPDSCPCLLDKEQVAPDSQSAFLKQHQADADSDSIAATDCATLFPRLPLAVIHISKWPPGSQPTLSLSERLALHSSYLL